MLTIDDLVPHAITLFEKIDVAIDLRVIYSIVEETYSTCGLDQALTPLFLSN